MKIPLRVIFLIFLFLIFLSGVFVQRQKKAQEPVVNATPKIAGEQIINNVSPIQLSATISAKKARPKVAGILITEYGDNLLVLINKNIRLAEDFVPTGLVKLNPRWTTYPGMQLRKESAEYLGRMIDTAREKGFGMIVRSAYRSYEEQFSAFYRSTSGVGVVATEAYIARPGHSQHQLGTTVDFNFSNPQSLSWLEKNSHKFGFVMSYPKGKEDITGYGYEPWHYRFIGVANAQKMKSLGLILDEYLQKYGVW